MSKNVWLVLQKNVVNVHLRKLYAHLIF